MTVQELLKRYQQGKRNFSGADLQDAQLQNVSLRHSDLLGANLRGANLYHADLRGVNLSGADLWRANLRQANLQGAIVHGADLRNTTMREANLRGAILRDADLRDALLWRANLHEADLQGADLRGADIDFSCLPLSCGGLHIQLDKKQLAQIAYHFCNQECNDSDYVQARDALLDFANTFHRVAECGFLE
jgi:uncharacterized protein YjbI with pentapeptide repeats